MSLDQSINEKIAFEFSTFITFSVGLLTDLNNNRKTLLLIFLILLTDSRQLAVSSMTRGWGMCRLELSQVMTRIILANIICSRKWWRSCNQPGETPTPGCVLPARISRNNIVGVHSCQLQQAPAGTYVTFRGYITHL